MCALNMVQLKAHHHTAAVAALSMSPSWRTCLQMMMAHDRALETRDHEGNSDSTAP